MNQPWGIRGATGWGLLPAGGRKGGWSSCQGGGQAT